MEPLSTIALGGLLAWASGLRLYLVIFCLGMMARFSLLTLPADLALLANPWVVGTAGFMAAMEFFADKIPAVDSVWDAIHTFIRIPAGAALTAAAVGFDHEAAALIAGLLGGTLTSGTHFTKAGTRALINTSPEPVTNWVASFGEESMVISGIWMALYQPAVFLGLLAVFILLMIWLLPKVWRTAKRVLTRFRNEAA